MDLSLHFEIARTHCQHIYGTEGNVDTRDNSRAWIRILA
jgi:hypothetical protein